MLSLWFFVAILFWVVQVPQFPHLGLFHFSVLQSSCSGEFSLFLGFLLSPFLNFPTISHLGLSCFEISRFLGFKVGGFFPNCCFSDIKFVNLSIVGFLLCFGFWILLLVHAEILIILSRFGCASFGLELGILISKLGIEALSQWWLD